MLISRRCPSGTSDSWRWTYWYRHWELRESVTLTILTFYPASATTLMRLLLPGISPSLSKVSFAFPSYTECHIFYALCLKMNDEFENKSTIYLLLFHLCILFGLSTKQFRVWLVSVCSFWFILQPIDSCTAEVSSCKGNTLWINLFGKKQMK